MSDDQPPTPVNDEQLLLLIEAIQLVASSPDGCGTVKITITRGKVTFIHPAPSLAARSETIYRERIWLRQLNHRLQG